MGPFINYSLHFVERCSIKVQCNRLIPKPSLLCAFYKGALGRGGGEGRRGGKKNWLGRQRQTKNIWSGPVSKVEWHQGCDSS